MREPHPDAGCVPAHLAVAAAHPATEPARAMLAALGIPCDDEDTRATPARFVKALLELTEGLHLDPARHLSVTFPPPSEDPGMVVVPGLPFVSVCLPGGQFVNAVGGWKRARSVAAGDQLWTLDEGRAVATNVVRVGSRRTRGLVEVETDAGAFRCTPDHPFATPAGWVEAQHLTEFSAIEWAKPRSLCRTRYTPAIGCDFGYAAGSVCAGGTVGKRRISLVGGSIQAQASGAYSLGAAGSWARKHGFRPESHRTGLIESDWVRVRRVTDVTTGPSNPCTVYSFTCEPYPTFLVGGHLSHNCEHHLLPFTGTATIGYLPEPGARIVGLSKLARVTQEYAARPQVQERLGDQIVTAITSNLDTLGAGCVLRAVHTCMTLRGARAAGAEMVTSHLTGRFRTDKAARDEFMVLATGR